MIFTDRPLRPHSDRSPPHQRPPGSAVCNWQRKLRRQIVESASPQLVPLEPSAVSEEQLCIQYRGAELKLPAGVDMEAVAAILRSLQSL